MKSVKFWLERPVAFCLVTLLAIPASAAAGTPPFQNFRASSTPVETLTEQQAVAQPAGNAAASSSPSAAHAADSSSTPEQTAPQNPQAASPPSGQTVQQNGTAPGGTAAAPEIKPEGVPASRPSGAAIAPAKQRRVRIFAIRTALVLGAAVAIGVVTAASLGSPSKPH
jgi:hypothetical protein